MKSIHRSLTHIKKERMPFDVRSLENHFINDYLRFYGINDQEVTYSHGYVSFHDENHFVQWFQPTSIKGTVLLVHGYFDHAAALSKTINYLLKQNYAVLTYDLQGHGLSTGNRAHINQFKEYVVFLEYLLTIMDDRIQKPLHVVAHSTGCAIVASYMMTNSCPFQKVIFISPLVRSYRWHVSKVGFYLLFPFIKEMKRMFKGNSSNTKYLQFVKEDPLQPQKLPLSWLKALIQWNNQVDTFQSVSHPLLIVQGKKDKTVDWRYNLKVLKEKFPHCHIQMIRKGKHQLLNEQEKIQKDVHEIIERYLLS
ncbi:alpha/beta hydrolase [Metabacillus iocasae]|uniref:Alpha-beta hydrolase superfamily lysophospholipase n=1 Tax=Priestia iocasae TaxID=2291674 RepID=A0ABS2QRV1_9BACI|nr:alpha/beta hydrolase [Metabacillus iocasae]MBM7702195.1 alpha-beta hydrolase superfamily lysophospholipase [Metabacillus iocasae]